MPESMHVSHVDGDLCGGVRVCVDVYRAVSPWAFISMVSVPTVNHLPIKNTWNTVPGHTCSIFLVTILSTVQCNKYYTALSMY